MERAALIVRPLARAPLPFLFAGLFAGWPRRLVPSIVVPLAMTLFLCPADVFLQPGNLMWPSNRAICCVHLSRSPRSVQGFFKTRQKRDGDNLSGTFAASGDASGFPVSRPTRARALPSWLSWTVTLHGLPS
jgi:hypothetical protein